MCTYITPRLLVNDLKNTASTNSTLGRQLCRTVDLVLKLDIYVIERDRRIANRTAPFDVDNDSNAQDNGSDLHK